jgi:hypothetical protein
MGFKPGLRSTSLGVGPDYSFLASEHTMVARAGVTLDAATVGADADGNKLLMAGTVLGKITASGKYGAYSNAAGDGRGTAVGFLNETVNLKDGDVVASMLEHGSVIVPRTSGLDSNARTDMAGRFFYVE